MLVLAGLAAWLAGPAARAAHAGSYVVYSCQDPTGAPASTSSWSFQFTDPVTDTHDDSCPRGGVHVALKAGVTHPSTADARMYFWAPDNTVITSYTLWRSAKVAAGTPYWFSAMERYGLDWRWAGTGCKGTTNNCSAVGNPSTPLADANKFSRTPPTPVTGIALYVSCGNDNAGTTACPATSPVAAETWLHRADITLADDSKPSFTTTPVGGLVDATAPVSGTASVSLLASDKGGGLTQAMVEVDGTVVTSQPLGGAGACATPYTARTPCPLNASATIPLDTTTLDDGTHQVRVLLQDAGGNTTAWGPVTLTTHNAPPDESCNPDPAVGADVAGVGLNTGLLLLGSHSTGIGPARVTLRYATKKLASVTGQVNAVDGTPLDGAGVCVVWRPEGTTAPLSELARVTTDPAGRFSVAVPRGSSREIFAIYRTPAGAVTARTVVRVIPRLTIKPSHRSLRNGQLLALRGTLSGGPIPSRGVLVTAEAWRGTRWQPFEQTHARGSSGSYRVSYRFVGTHGVQRYTLRVRVAAQAAYPYLAGVSKRIHVRVHG
ncbi:hypothetical protein DSM104299_00519 [Baekduia alba]|nr:hypothetical protein DSM104299_00519 [Baekduia alba]